MWNDYEVETIACATMTLRSGNRVPFRFAVSGIRPLFAGIAFRCELGEIRLRLDPTKDLEVFLEQGQPHRLDAPHPRPAQQHVLAAFRREWLHFLDAIRTTAEWDLRRETGLITSDVMTQCREMAKASCSGIRE